MAGKRCPKCDQQTFFEVTTGRKCTKCDCEMKLPANSTTSGRGSKCTNCNKLTVFKDKCRSCGATYVQVSPKKLMKKE